MSDHLSTVCGTGRNKGLSGLAAAIVKLWEKSEIVKLGVKRGVQNTNNERMAEELKVWSIFDSTFLLRICMHIYI